MIVGQSVSLSACCVDAVIISRYFSLVLASHTGSSVHFLISSYRHTDDSNSQRRVSSILVIAMQTMLIDPYLQYLITWWILSKFWSWSLAYDQTSDGEVELENWDESEGSKDECSTIDYHSDIFWFLQKECFGAEHPHQLDVCKEIFWNSTKDQPRVAWHHSSKTWDWMISLYGHIQRFSWLSENYRKTEISKIPVVWSAWWTGIIFCFARSWNLQTEDITKCYYISCWSRQRKFIRSGWPILVYRFKIILQTRKTLHWMRSWLNSLVKKKANLL